MVFDAFFRLLIDTYPECKDSSYTCFVLDKAGFVILHDDFLSPIASAKTLEYVHITEKDKDIAEDLIKKGHMVRKQCRNLSKLKLEFFYEVLLSRRGVNTLSNGQRCKKYQLSQVDRSNVIVGRLKC